MLCHVNLIPINKVDERDYEKPDKTYIYKFRDIFTKRIIYLQLVRREMGADIRWSLWTVKKKTQII